VVAVEREFFREVPRGFGPFLAVFFFGVVLEVGGADELGLCAEGEHGGQEENQRLFHLVGRID